MRICRYCDFENYSDGELCERCRQPIARIRHEFFNIGIFIKQNYQYYAIIGIFLVLYEFTIREDSANLEIFFGIIPLTVSIYLILYLVIKAGQIIISRQWQPAEKFIHIDNIFQFFIFALIHIALVLVPLASLPHEVRNYMGFLSATFLFLVLISSALHHEYHRKAFRILLTSILFFEVFILLAISFPSVIRICGNGSILDYYAFLIQLTLYLALGGYSAYFLTTVLFIGISKGHQSYLSFIKQIFGEDKNMSLSVGVIVLFGLQIGFFLLNDPSI